VQDRNEYQSAAGSLVAGWQRSLNDR
jgi:hypothetical protein